MCLESRGGSMRFDILISMESTMHVQLLVITQTDLIGVTLSPNGVSVMSSTHHHQLDDIECSE